jgi:hypothetical protein
MRAFPVAPIPCGGLDESTRERSNIRDMHARIRGNRDGTERDDTPPRPRSTDGVATGLLALQRTAGNHAVARGLSSLRSARLQRDPSTLIEGNEPKVDPAVARKTAMDAMVGFYALKPGGDVTTWARNNVLPRYAENKTFTNADVTALVSWMTSDYPPIWDHGVYDTVLDNLAGRGGDALYIARLRGFQWPGGKKPRVLGGDTPTTGNIVAASRVIRIKATLPVPEILDTLLFECQNILQVEAFIQATKEFLPAGPGKRPEMYGFATAALEYESDRRYIEELKSMHQVNDLPSLLQALAVPSNLRTPQAYQDGKPIGENKVNLPDRTVLSSQAQRQSLWWFKTATWPEDKRKLAWISANHGEGVASTAELYQSQAGKGKVVGQVLF